MSIVFRITSNVAADFDGDTELTPANVASFARLGTNRFHFVASTRIGKADPTTLVAMAAERMNATPVNLMAIPAGSGNVVTDFLLERAFIHEPNLAVAVMGLYTPPLPGLANGLRATDTPPLIPSSNAPALHVFGVTGRWGDDIFDPPSAGAVVVPTGWTISFETQGALQPVVELTLFPVVNATELGPLLSGLPHPVINPGP